MWYWKPVALGIENNKLKIKKKTETHEKRTFQKIEILFPETKCKIQKKY